MRHSATKAAGLQYDGVQGAAPNLTCGMEARRVAVQIAEATLSATNSSAVERECRPSIAVGIIAVVVATTIIDTKS